MTTGKVVFAGRRSRALSLTTSPPVTPDFSLSASALTIVQGATSSLVVTVSRVGNHASAITLTLSGLPSGVTAPSATVGGASSTGTLTLTATSGAATGAATVTVTGSDGTLTRTTTFTLTVDEAGSFDLYVEEGGTGTGTSADPFGTITAAIAAATTGQSVYVRAGTYREAVTVGKAITIQGATGATLKGSDILPGWAETTYSGSPRWYAAWTPKGRTPDTIDGWTTMLAEKAGTGWAESVFVDGTEWPAVATNAECVGDVFWIDATLNLVVLGADPAARTVEVSAEAFVLKLTAAATIRGLTVRHCANVAQGGAMVQAGNGCTLDGNDFGYASACVLDVSSTGATITNNLVHHGGQLGVTGKAFTLAFTGNEVYENNTRGYDPAWEAGGSKFHQGGAADLATAPYQGNSITSNTFRNNYGPGLWVDVYGNGYTITGNRCYSNGWQGINFELSKGAVITGNVCYQNGHGITGSPHGRTEPPLWALGANIYVLASDDVNVHHNVCAWGADGITVWQDGRETPMETVSVDDNTIIQHAAAGDAYALAYLESGGGAIAVTVEGSRNVVYAASGVYFNWLGDGASRTTSRATMASTRGDWTGTSLTLVEAQNVCAANGIPTSP
jgi:parallel beta-helix repeat protein